MFMSFGLPANFDPHLPFATLLDGLKAAGEDTRLRLLAVLGEADLTVSDLTEIMGQSQPRISRHLKLLADAGLVERHREASWVFYRRASEGANGVLAVRLLALMDPNDPVLARDRERLADVRAARGAAAQTYFRTHAEQWNRIRSLHVPEAEVEAAVRAILGGGRIDALLDLGTGTGRMLELFGGEITRGLGLDLSPDMLAVARANLERAGLRNCSVRQGDIYNLNMPRDSFDVVIIHQVLHFLDDGARAVREAARVLRPGGRLLVVDFAPHDLEFLREAHAHRRLGFSAETVEGWMVQAGLEPVTHTALEHKASDSKALVPERNTAGTLIVSLWLARDPRVRVAAELQREMV